MAGPGSRRKELRITDYDSKGLPVILRRPEPEKLVKCPKFLGQYFFGDSAHLPLNYDKNRYFEENRDRAWCVVATVDVKTSPGVPVLPVDKTKDMKVFKTPASSLWQSSNGRYMLYPPPVDPKAVDPKDKEKGFDGFPLDGKEDESSKWFFPSVEWEEYYCVPAVAGEKFNYRNPCDWASFMESCRLLKKKKTFTSDDVRAANKKPKGDRTQIKIKIKKRGGGGLQKSPNPKGKLNSCKKSHRLLSGTKHYVDHHQNIRNCLTSDLRIPPSDLIFLLLTYC
jgi:hypothetical protein